MLRIVAGRHGGRRIATLAGDFARPTSDRVREALFSILAARQNRAGTRLLDGARVLDACAGSGALGLEALSRGAAHATFFDNSRRAIKIVQDNIAALGETAATDARQADVTRPPHAPGSAACDLVFIDAPYDSDIASDALPALAGAGWIAAGGLVVVECARGTAPAPPDGFSEVDRRRYGATELVFYEYAG